jgi:hypothetical protein
VRETFPARAIPFRHGPAKGREDTAAMQGTRTRFASRTSAARSKVNPVGIRVRVLDVARPKAGLRGCSATGIVREPAPSAEGSRSDAGDVRQHQSRGSAGSCETAGKDRQPRPRQRHSMTIWPASGTCGDNRCVVAFGTGVQIPGVAQAYAGPRTARPTSRKIRGGGHSLTRCNPGQTVALCGGMDSAQFGSGPPARAPGFEPRAPLTMWQRQSHAWLAYPPLAWCELLPAANRQHTGDTRPKSAKARRRAGKRRRRAFVSPFRHGVLSAERRAHGSRTASPSPRQP